MVNQQARNNTNTSSASGAKLLCQFIFVIIKFVALNVYIPFKIKYERDRTWKTVWIVFLSVYDGIMAAIFCYLIFICVQACLKKKPTPQSNRIGTVQPRTRVQNAGANSKNAPTVSGQFTNVYSI